MKVVKETKMVLEHVTTVNGNKVKSCKVGTMELVLSKEQMEIKLVDNICGYVLTHILDRNEAKDIVEAIIEEMEFSEPFLLDEIVKRREQEWKPEVKE